MIEKDIEKKFVFELKKIDCIVIKFVSPGNVGVPDRIVIGHYGNFYFVELKRPTHYRIGKGQRYWSRVLSSRFIKNFIIKNEEELKAFIKEVIKDERILKPINRIGFFGDK